MASTRASISKVSKRPKINIIPPKQLFVDLTQDDTKTPSPKLPISSPSAPNAPSKTPSTKDTSSSSIDYIPKSPTSSTSLSPNGYLNPPTSPPPRVSPPPPTQENASMDITLTLSPITPLDVQFDTPSPSPPIIEHPIPWNLLEAHGQENQARFPWRPSERDGATHQGCYDGTSEDENYLEGIIDYLEPKSYDRFIDLDDEAYKERKCKFLGMTYRKPPTILIKKVEVTRYTIDPGETYTKIKVLGIEEIPRTEDNIAKIRAGLLEEIGAEGGSRSKEMEFEVTSTRIHVDWLVKSSDLAIIIQSIEQCSEEYLVLILLLFLNFISLNVQ
ncbi:hypothetical protein Tco_0675430 [Tanacetum coccineum]